MQSDLIPYRTLVKTYISYICTPIVFKQVANYIRDIPQQSLCVLHHEQ